MMRFAAEDLAVTLGPATCHGEQCQIGDTCTNVTNVTPPLKKPQVPKPQPDPKQPPKPKNQYVEAADLDALLVQLRELTPAD